MRTIKLFFAGVYNSISNSLYEGKAFAPKETTWNH